MIMMFLYSARAEWWGWMAGWMYIVGFCALLGAQFIAEASQFEFPQHILLPLQTVFYLALFLCFLNGIRAFALRKSDARLVQTINTLMVLTAAQFVVFIPFTFILYFEVSFVTLSLFAVVPLVSAAGVMFIRLAELFSVYQLELGTLGKRIVIWNKIGGWMLASVILIIPGFFVIAVGEFYLWRLLARTRVPGDATQNG